MRSVGHSEAVEMYLKSLAVLGGADHPVPSTHLAGRLGVTGAAVNEMLRRLIKEGLATHEPYHGYQLTDDGRAAAWDVIRRDRLWERFLVDHLDLDPIAATAWACQLEHATSPEVIEALDRFLGHPATCPRGLPIPRSVADPVRPEERTLSDTDAGESVRLVAFEDEDPEVLRYLRAHGPVIGTTVRVTEVGPRRSVISVDHPDGAASIGAELASGIHVVPVARAAS